MLRLSNITFAYPGQQALFNELDLQIQHGGICGLLGKNGSGKTTLLRIIAGLIFPLSGSSKVLECESQQRHPAWLENIFFLPEELYVPELTAKQFEKHYSYFYPKFSHELFIQALKEFSLPYDKPLNRFSHGQKKEFFISFGLASNTQLFILDEPTNGLDIPSKAHFRKLLASTMTEDRLFLISTHQVHDVENLIDSIVFLDQGKIIFHQSLEETSRKIAFIEQSIAPDLQESIYFEKRLNGYLNVMENVDGEETHMDLEVLFNAVIQNPNKFGTIFSKV